MNPSGGPAEGPGPGTRPDPGSPSIHWPLSWWVAAYAEGWFPMDNGPEDHPAGCPHAPGAGVSAATGNLQLYRSTRRAVLPLDGSLHVPRSLRRFLGPGRFRLTLNQAFDAVLAGCADRPSTWISPELAAVYRQLHGGGIAHSIEAWDEDGLAGGLLGVAIGACWIGESMFHRRSHASNVVLVRLVEALCQGGFLLFDVQLSNPHLVRFGCRELTEGQFSRQLAVARQRPATLRLSEASLTSEAWVRESEWFK